MKEQKVFVTDLAIQSDAVYDLDSQQTKINATNVLNALRERINEDDTESVHLTAAIRKADDRISITEITIQNTRHNAGRVTNTVTDATIDSHDAYMQLFSDLSAALTLGLSDTPFNDEVEDSVGLSMGCSDEIYLVKDNKPTADEELLNDPEVDSDSDEE